MAYKMDEYHLYLNRDGVDISANLPEPVNFTTASEADGTETVETTTSQTVTGTTYRAEFTAYGPPWNKMEGSGTFANGGSADAALARGDLCCAAPKKFAFGAHIQVQGTGTDQDGKIYTVTDRGGAIKVKSDGTVRIDLLMANRKLQNSFGRRSGSIIVEE